MKRTTKRTAQWRFEVGQSIQAVLPGMFESDYSAGDTATITARRGDLLRQEYQVEFSDGRKLWIYHPNWELR